MICAQLILYILLIFHVTMTKNTSIVLIGVIAAVMVAGALALTLATSSAYAFQISVGGDGGIGGARGANGVNGDSPGNSDFGHSHQGASGGANSHNH